MATRIVASAGVLFTGAAVPGRRWSELTWTFGLLRAERGRDVPLVVAFRVPRFADGPDFSGKVLTFPGAGLLSTTGQDLRQKGGVYMDSNIVPICVTEVPADPLYAEAHDLVDRIPKHVLLACLPVLRKVAVLPPRPGPAQPPPRHPLTIHYSPGR